MCSMLILFISILKNMNFSEKNESFNHAQALFRKNKTCSTIKKMFFWREKNNCWKTKVIKAFINYIILCCLIKLRSPFPIANFQLVQFVRKLCKGKPYLLIGIIEYFYIVHYFLALIQLKALTTWKLFHR